jgi:hypothetical protein
VNSFGIKNSISQTMFSVDNITIFSYRTKNELAKKIPRHTGKIVSLFLFIYFFGILHIFDTILFIIKVIAHQTILAVGTIVEILTIRTKITSDQIRCIKAI